jgi:hypothetical protein
MAPGPAAASLAVRIDGIANAEIIEAGPRSPRADDPGQHVA